MSNQEPANKGILYDYDPVNAFIDNEQQRNQQLIKDREAKRSETYAKAIVISALGIGVFIVLLALAIWILNLDSKEGLKVYNIGGDITDEQIASLDQALKDMKAEITQLGLERQKEISMIKEVVSIEKALGKDVQAEGVSIKFTVFESVSLASDVEIVTGRNYDPKDLKFPYKQYCYHSKRLRDGVSTTTDLATKENKGTVVSAKGLKSLKKLAQKYCAFI
jgi:hypothetical protein